MYKVFSFLFHQHRLVYSHHLASFEDRNEIERKYSRPSNNHRACTNAPIMIQTAITASSFSLFFFSSSSRRSRSTSQFDEPDRLRLLRDVTTLIDARRSCSPSTDETSWSVVDGEIDFHREH